MIVDFIVSSGQTVPSDYSWDKGTPLDGSVVTTTTAYTTQRYISGYAPGVKAIFLNTSTPDPTYSQTSHNWDFGDFYNDSNNTVSLSCLSFVEHTYVMPGKYTVTLNITQAQTDEDEQPEIINPLDLICRGKGGITWYWDALDPAILFSQCISWDDAECQEFNSFTFVTTGYDKWWDDELKCFQKYCKLWSWAAMEQGYIFSSPQINPDGPVTDNPVRWRETKYNQPFIKKWMYEPNNKPCTIDIINVVEDLADTKIQQIVEVFELPPTAGITCLTQPVTGTSPYTVLLSPTACKPGSFPIDRIDWDFGDGSPIKTITRYTSVSSDLDFTYTNLFSSDPIDIRNYNIQHTYKINKNTYPVFYPSLTCYSANTHTSDSCSTIIGPISYPVPPAPLQLIKSKNTTKGIIYAFNIDKNITFTTTTELSSPIIIPTIPANKLVNSLKDTLISYGNPGADYPLYITPTCIIDL
jgi:hypothetical protein